MKDGAVLLNFARGPLVNNEAVLEALENGKLKHYVTDFPNDKVIGKPGVIATPHLGASTTEAEDNCATMAVQQLRDGNRSGTRKCQGAHRKSQATCIRIKGAPPCSMKRPPDKVRLSSLIKPSIA